MLISIHHHPDFRYMKVLPVLPVSLYVNQTTHRYLPMTLNYYRHTGIVLIETMYYVIQIMRA